jgi:hypothetical protein
MGQIWLHRWTIPTFFWLYQTRNVQAIKLPAQVAGRLSLNSNEVTRSSEARPEAARGPEAGQEPAEACDTETSSTLTR